MQDLTTRATSAFAIAVVAAIMPFFFASSAGAVRYSLLDSRFVIHSNSLRNCGMAIVADNGGTLRSLGGSLGLGIEGGSDDLLVDGAESITFYMSRFGPLAPRNVSGVRYRIVGSNSNNDGIWGETFVEAFHDGQSLGVRTVTADLSTDLDALYGTTIDHFRITPIDAFSVDYVEYDVPHGDATVLEFAAMGDLYFPFATPCGVFVNGTGIPYIESGEGLGLNGIPIIDNNNSVFINFPVPVDSITLRSVVGSTDGDGVFGEGTIEAFGSSGASLGIQLIGGPMPQEIEEIGITALFGDVPISGFSLTSTESRQIKELRFVPEPTGALPLAATLAVLAQLGRARQTHRLA